MSGEARCSNAETEAIENLFAEFGRSYYWGECLHRELCNVCALGSAVESSEMTVPRFGVLIPWGLIVVSVLALDGALRGRVRPLAFRLLLRFPKERREAIVPLAGEQLQQPWADNQHYPEGSVGRLMEPAVAWIVEKYNRTRSQAAIMIGGLIWAAGFGTVLSFNVLAEVKFWRGTIFDNLDHLSINIMLPLG